MWVLFFENGVSGASASFLFLLLVKACGSLVTSEKELLALPHMAIDQTDLVVVGFVFGQFLGF